MYKEWKEAERKNLLQTTLRNKIDCLHFYFKCHFMNMSIGMDKMLETILTKCNKKSNKILKSTAYESINLNIQGGFHKGLLHYYERLMVHFLNI